MKITLDMRCALRAVLNAKRSFYRNNGHHDKNKAHLAEFLKKPKNAAAVRVAARLLVRATGLTNEAEKMMGDLGLNANADWVRDEAKYLAAGGKLEPQPLSQLCIAATLDLLARATPEEGIKILAEHGINWEEPIKSAAPTPKAPAMTPAESKEAAKASRKILKHHERNFLPA